MAEKLLTISERHKCHQFRISGAEPILGQASAMHLADVIKLVGGKFIMEANGIAIGYDPDLLDHLTERL